MCRSASAPCRPVNLRLDRRLACLARLTVPLLLVAALVGCAGYQIGSRTLFPADVQTVYVPMIESQSFRRGLGERLTEAVVKEIEVRTPYKVVPADRADSVLLATLVADRKRVVVESPTDEARDVEVTYDVRVRWTRHGQDVLGGQGTVPLPPDVVSILRTATFIPEAGQSYGTAEEQAIQRVASQIVDLMEATWYTHR